MAVWRGDEDTPDWELVRDGAVTKFFDSVILSEAAGWLEEHGYRVVAVDASRWAADGTMHDDLAAALSFPSYYGKNLNALTDCIRDVAEQEYGWAATDTGLVLVIHRFDEFHARDAALAHAVLDIYAGAARDAALLGNRMMCLIQSSDPRLDVADVGATSPRWNRREWLTRNRIS